MNFVAEKPNFDLSNFEIKPIVCCINKLISWQMELPPLTGSDPEAISVEIVKSQSITKYFDFVGSNKVLRTSESGLNSSCPPKKQIEFKFNLLSERAGKNS